MKLGEPLIFFVHPGDVDACNAGKLICQATQYGFGGTGANGLIDLEAYYKIGPQVFTDVIHVDLVSEGLAGSRMKWMTCAEAEAAGVDLSDPDQDLTQLA